MTTERFTVVFFLLLAVAACGGGNSALGTSGGTPGFSTPEATVHSLVAAMKQQDAEAAADCWIASEREAKLQSYRTTYAIPGTSGNPALKFEKVENKLGYTIGTYSVPRPAGGTTESYVALVNEDGQWKCSEAEWQKYWKAVLQQEKR